MWKRTLAMTLMPVLLGIAQQDEETRQIFDTHFAQARVAANPSSAQVAATYRRFASVGSPKSGVAVAKQTVVQRSAYSESALGITIWKMLPAAEGDVARLLVLEGGGRTKTAVTPHRVEAGELLHLGDQVRLSIETPVGGFLYVVDQEVYANGDVGPPYLIFPVMGTRNGENRVLAGQLVDIPDQRDPVNVFTLQAKDPRDRGERLTILLSPTPIGGLHLTTEAQQLPAVTFRAWSQQFLSNPEHFELAGGKGQAWTRAEQQAGSDPSRLLTLADPAPQTVFVFPGGQGRPVLATIVLKFER